MQRFWLQSDAVKVLWSAGAGYRMLRFCLISFVISRFVLYVFLIVIFLFFYFVWLFVCVFFFIYLRVYFFIWTLCLFFCCCVSTRQGQCDCFKSRSVYTWEVQEGEVKNTQPGSHVSRCIHLNSVCVLMLSRFLREKYLELHVMFSFLPPHVHCCIRSPSRAAELREN